MINLKKTYKAEFWYFIGLEEEEFEIKEFLAYSKDHAKTLLQLYCIDERILPRAIQITEI
jgi:hypothetical protein